MGKRVAMRSTQTSGRDIMRGSVPCRSGPRRPRAHPWVPRHPQSQRPCLRHPLRSWWAAPSYATITFGSTDVASRHLLWSSNLIHHSRQHFYLKRMTPLNGIRWSGSPGLRLLICLRTWRADCEACPRHSKVATLYPSRHEHVTTLRRAHLAVQQEDFKTRCSSRSRPC